MEATGDKCGKEACIHYQQCEEAPLLAWDGGVQGDPKVPKVHQASHPQAIVQVPHQEFAQDFKMDLRLPLWLSRRLPY